MDERCDPVTAGASRALLQLCGEVLLTAPPTRQPGIVRAGASVGLELLDLLLNPDHVVRATEQLTLRDTTTIARRVEVDISLDRLSRRDEEQATQLSTLISGRTGGDGRPTSDGRLWLPLDTVPRPLSVPVLVADGEGRELTRPSQRKIRRALEAALYHVLRESLRAHPEFGIERAAVNRIMREDDRARWLLQSALVAVCEVGPDTPRSRQRLAAVTSELPDLDIDVDRLTLHELVTSLGHLVDRTRDADDAHRRDGSSAHRTLALDVLAAALARDEPLLRLIDLVHRHDFVVASVDRSLREQSVRYELPDSEARRESVIEDWWERNRRMLDPREHNYTVRMRVPLPENLPQYNVCVRAPAGTGTRSDCEVSLIAAIRYDDHPGRSAIDALRACAEELMRTWRSYRGSAPPGESDAVPTPDPEGRKVSFIASRARRSLDRLERIVELQDQAAADLDERWTRVSTRTLRDSVRQVQRVTAQARQRLDGARAALATLTDHADEVHARTPAAARALNDAAAVVEHPLLGLQLISSEVPGQEIARLRINQSRLASRSSPHPRVVDVWATVNDEAQPFVYAAIVPALSVATLVYVVGRLLFDRTWWFVPWSPFTIPVLGGGPDAIVAVLLLVPAFAMTRTTLPERRSVAGMLRRPARLFVVGSVVTLCLSAIAVATQVASEPLDGAAAAHDAVHPHLLVWTFRGTLAFFLLWTAWATLAGAVRRRHVWRPKGLKDLFGPEIDGDRRTRRRPGRWHRSRRWRRRFAYGNKSPDAEIDLSLPSQSFPLRAAPAVRESR